MTNVFTYGSLMYEPVWSRVVSNHYRSQAATINGFKRYAVIDQDFPAILPGEKDDSLDGILYFSVSDSDLARLDEFESYFYFRKTVPIAGFNSLQAEVYALSPDFANIASDKPWHPCRFKESGIDRFIKRFR